MTKRTPQRCDLYFSIRFHLRRLSRDAALLVFTYLLTACKLPSPQGIEIGSGPKAAMSCRVATYSSMALKFKRHGILLDSVIVKVESLDGVPVPWGKPQYFITAPGRHVAIYRASTWTPANSSPYGPATRIEFNTREGMSYVILGASFAPPKEGERKFVWVHEVESGRIVGGMAPPDFHYTCEIGSNGSNADCKEQ